MTEPLTVPPRTIHHLRITDIIVKDGRQRSDMGDLEGLAESILKHGLMQPIILNRENVLIAGGRRLEAHKLNGMTHVDCMYRDELDELDLEELELEENIRRKQLTWQEENAATARLHKLRQQRDPNWSQAQTAVLIAKPGAVAPQQRDVSQALTLDRMMKLFPEIGGAKTKAQALNLAKAKAKQVTRQIEVQRKPEDYREVEEKLWLGDSVQAIKEIEDNYIDAIITDPPFGIDYDAQVSGSVREADVYKDDATKYEYILGMVPDLYRVLKPDGWCIWFFGMSWYERVKEVFRAAGFTVDEIPIIWDRSEGRTFTNRPDKYFAKGYDVALHAFKGDPHLVVKSKPNIIRVAPVDTKDRELTVERPVELYAELIRRTTIRGQLVADFFSGSGSCLAAAASLERDFLGVEIDPARRATAIQKIKAYTPTKA